MDYVSLHYHLKVYLYHFSCTVSYPTNLEALAAFEKLRKMIGKHNLVSVTEGKGMKKQTTTGTEDEAKQ